MRPFFLIKKFFLGLCLLALSSCGGGKPKEYSIGVDPYWYPLNIKGLETNVLAFSQELLQEIALMEKIHLVRIDRNWSNLLFGLEEQKYDGILSSMQPYLFTEKKYDYSDVFLKTGPVLVVPVGAKDVFLDKTDSNQIGILQGDNAVFIAEKNPTLIIREYFTIPDALNAVASGAIDGALIDILPAQAYCKNIYSGVLKIATAPLSDAGLRMITLHQEYNHLMDIFDEGLKKLMSNGRYEALLEKWDLTETKKEKR